MNIHTYTIHTHTPLGFIHSYAIISSIDLLGLLSVADGDPRRSATYSNTLKQIIISISLDISIMILHLSLALSLSLSLSLYIYIYVYMYM